MALGIHVCKAIGQQTDLETCLCKVLASVAYAEFGCYATDIYVSSVKKLENFSK